MPRNGGVVLLATLFWINKDLEKRETPTHMA